MIGGGSRCSVVTEIQPFLDKSPWQYKVLKLSNQEIAEGKE